MRVWLQPDCNLCSWREGVKRTKDSVDQNPGAHTLLRPAQVGWAGWSGAPLNGNLPPHGSAQHLFQGTSMIPAPLRGQAGHVGRGAQTGAACGTATAVHFLVVFKELCERGVSFWAQGGCQPFTRRGAAPLPPLLSSHAAPPRPPPSQSVAWLLSSHFVFLLSSPFLCLIY